VFTICVFIFIVVFQIVKNIQLESAFQAYYSLYTNWDNLMGLLITNPDLGAYDYGRIGSVFFGFEKMTEDIAAFFIGHGPGSITYSGYTTGFVNPLAKLQGTSFLLMALMYELGIWGPLLLIAVFYSLFIKWKKTNYSFNGLSKYYFDNINVLL